jgi:hypothetical protein
LVESPYFLQLGNVIGQFALSVIPSMSERDVLEVHAEAYLLSMLGVPEIRRKGDWWATRLASSTV